MAGRDWINDDTHLRLLLLLWLFNVFMATCFGATHQASLMQMKLLLIIYS